MRKFILRKTSKGGFFNWGRRTYLIYESDNETGKFYTEAGSSNLILEKSIKLNKKWLEKSKRSVADSSKKYSLMPILLVLISQSAWKLRRVSFSSRSLTRAGSHQIIRFGVPEGEFASSLVFSKKKRERVRLKKEREREFARLTPHGLRLFWLIFFCFMTFFKSEFTATVITSDKAKTFAKTGQ